MDDNNSKIKRFFENLRDKWRTNVTKRVESRDEIGTFKFIENPMKVVYVWFCRRAAETRGPVTREVKEAVPGWPHRVRVKSRREGLPNDEYSRCL